MLAIVIPYYKISFFKETLQSLADQTDKRFKAYIGDDASLEDPSNLLKKYRGHFEFKYQKFTSNLGSKSLTKQWDRCISLSKNEEWLMILGDDDYISSNFVEEFYKSLDEINSLNINVVHFAVNVLKTNENTLNTYKHPKIENATDNFFRKYFGKSHGSLSEQVFRKEAYLKHGFRDLPLAWGSDDFAWLDFTDFGEIYGIDEATAFFRISSVNISRSGFESALKMEAKYQLFKLIVSENLNKFNNEQRLKLILHYQSLSYRYHKMSLILLFKISKLFYFEKEYKYIYKSARKLLIYYIKKRIR